MTGGNYTAQSKPSDTMIIYCADHRFQEAVAKFITEVLKITIFNPIVIAGGALAVASDHFAKFGYIWDQIDFYVEERGIKRIVLINHEDCSWYEYEHPDFDPGKLKDLGRSDLNEAAAKIRDKHPGVKIKAFWAELSGNEITFRKVI